MVWHHSMSIFKGFQSTSEVISFYLHGAFRPLANIFPKLGTGEVMPFFHILPQIFEAFNRTTNVEDNMEMPTIGMFNMRYLFDFLGNFFPTQRIDCDHPFAKFDADSEIMSLLYDFLKKYPIQISLSIPTKNKKIQKLKLQDAMLTSAYQVIYNACQVNKELANQIIDNESSMSYFNYLCKFVIFDPSVICEERLQTKNHKIKPFEPLEKFIFEFAVKNESFVSNACRELVIVLLEFNKSGLTIDQFNEHKARNLRYLFYSLL